MSDAMLGVVETAGARSNAAGRSSAVSEVETVN